MIDQQKILSSSKMFIPRRIILLLETHAKNELTCLIKTVLLISIKQDGLRQHDLFVLKIIII